MNHKGHLKWMAITALAIFFILILMGKPAGEALPLGIALACPLMMVMMMFGGGHAGHGQHTAGPRETGNTGHHDHRSATSSKDGNALF